MKKITRATLKSFIRNNIDSLYINVKTEFDGMTDGCEDRHDGFVKASTNNEVYMQEHNLGVEGLYLVGQRDYFEAYEDDNFIGIDYYNCCGHGIIAIRKVRSAA